MRIVSLLLLVSMSAAAQSASSDSGAKPSAAVQPALDKVAQAGSAVDLNRWKGGNSLRGEVDANLGSIQKDLQNTLPPLLLAADQSPSSVSTSLPVLLNLDALYSVLLRVEIAGKANAPRDQADALDSALSALDGARRDLGSRIIASAVAQEKQVAQMQATMQQQAAQIAAAQQAAAAAAATPPPTVKKKAKKKAAAPSSSAQNQ